MAPTKTWTGFPDPENPGNELLDHTFDVMAEALGWKGSAEELEEGLRRIRSQRSEVSERRMKDDCQTR